MWKCHKTPLYFWTCSPWKLKILGKNSRTSFLSTYDHTTVYSVIAAKIPISLCWLNIFINNDSCRLQASFLDSLLLGLLQMLQLRRQATSNRTQSPLLKLTFTSNMFWPSNRFLYFCSKQEMIFQQCMQLDQEGSRPLQKFVFLISRFAIIILIWFYCINHNFQAWQIQYVLTFSFIPFNSLSLLDLVVSIAFNMLITLMFFFRFIKLNCLVSAKASMKNAVELWHLIASLTCWIFGSLLHTAV